MSSEGQEVSEELAADLALEALLTSLLGAHVARGASALAQGILRLLVDHAGRGLQVPAKGCAGGQGSRVTLAAAVLSFLRGVYTTVFFFGLFYLHRGLVGAPYWIFRAASWLRGTSF